MADAGDTWTRTVESMITVMALNAVDLTQLVATTSAVFGLGTVAGAVYNPFAVMVPYPASGLDTAGIVH
jgi:hypothetical protein